MKRIILISAAIISTLISFNTLAQRMSPEEQAAAAVGTRQAVFKLLAFNMGPLQGMARGGDYDAPFYMALQESRALQRRSRNSYYGQLNNRPKKPVDDWTYEELRDAINVPRGFHFGGSLYTEKDVSCFHFVFFLSFSLT